MAEVKHEVTYLSDVDGILTVPSTPTKGNLPVFGDKTDLGTSVSDSGKSISDFVTQDNIGDAVKSASADILAEISGAYAIKAYSADQWSANTNYPTGSFCQHDGVGYRCKEEHESGTEFDASKWEVVMTSDGKSAIDAMLFGYSKDGLVGMNDVAASFDSDAQYVAGQLVAKDGTLQVCTKSGRGGAGAEFDSGAAVEKAISARVSGLVHQDSIVAEFSKDESYVKGQVCSYGGKFYECTADSDKIDFSLGNWVERKFTDLLPTKTSAFENDSGFAYAVDIPKAVSSLTNDLNYISSNEIVPKYDTLSRTYSKGDVCAHDDKIWVCTDDVKKGEDWSEDKWVRTTLWAVIPDTTAKWDAIEGMPDNIVYGGSIVPEYSDKSSYEAGSLCSYKGKFYKAASYVPTGAPFTSGEGGYWEEVVYNDLIRNVSDFVNDVGYATESQIAREFSVESPYSVGDLCYRNGTLYVCKSAVEKGHGWNDADWSQTTISDQIPKITDVTWDSIIDRPGDLVHGNAVVGDFDATRTYKVGDVCSKDGKFYLCTDQVNPGDAWNSNENGDWKEVSYDEIVSLKKVSAFENDARYVSSSQIAKEYVKSESVSYAVGDVCSHDGRIYVCKTAASNEEFDEEKWTETDVASLSHGTTWDKVEGRPDLSDMVEGRSVIEPYDTSEEGYSEGDVCSHDGKFYVCIVDSIAKDAKWNVNQWDETTLLDQIPKAADLTWDSVDGKPEDLVHGDAVVGDFSSDRKYETGDVCSKDGKFYLCIDQVNPGDAWNSNENGDWKEVSYDEIVSLKKVSVFENDSRYVSSSQIAKEYVKSESVSYAVGDVCSHDGRIYVCKTAASNEEFDEEKWTETDVASLSHGTTWDKVEGRPDLSDMVEGRSVIEPYDTSEEGYSEGDVCSHDGKFYVCIVDSIAKDAKWNVNQWEETTLLDQIPKAVDLTWDAIDGKPEDLVHGGAVVADFSSEREYKAGDVCSKDGKFYLCIDTVNPGDAWNSGKNGDWKEISYDEIVSLKKVSTFENDSRYVSSSQIANEYDSKKKYEKGDVCTKDGDIYVCQSPVSSGAIWNDDNWSKKTVSELVGQTQTQADWDEKDASEYSYIKNKPDIPFKIVTVTDHVDNATTARFDLTDRAVNVIEATIDAEKSIVLAIPERNASQSGDSLALELCVVFNVSVKVDPTDDPVSKVKVSFFGANVVDCYGSYVDVSIPVGTKVSFRLTECYGSGSRYMVISGYGDYAYNSIALIDKALDDILASYGEVGASELGMYLKDDNGAYHQVKLVTDPETGEVSIGVEQEGV